MADSADRRSEGKRSSNCSAMYSRRRNRRLINAGKCLRCGSATVQNRQMCYRCSDAHHIPAVIETNARRFFKVRGITRENLKTVEGKKYALQHITDLFTRGKHV